MQADALHASSEIREIENVWILPVGSAGMHHASAFSPTAIRRLVNNVRDKYDVILIDTGPVLGSIEASAVAASADAVILTIARGQQRVLVERSLRHLLAVGANIAGIVFNRAETKDFERSVSRFSVRSVTRDASTNGNGNGNGHTKSTNPDAATPPQRRNGATAGDDFGAVVGAVVSSFKPPNGNDNPDHDHA